MTIQNEGSWSPSQVKKTAISMTEAAIDYLQKQITKQGHGIGLRLGIKKSGCTGYSYVTEIIDHFSAEDYQFPLQHNLILVVDKQSFPFLNGTIIDYVKEGLNRRLKFNNPNEKHSCGCGESFAVE